MSLLGKRERYRNAFLYEKSLKPNINAERFALIALFSCKNEIFVSTDRDFYKNAHIYTPVRLALSFLIDLFLGDRACKLRF